MEHRMAKPAAILAAFALVTSLFSSRVLAATPDGLGPWADNVVSTAQGLRKDGSAVPAERSNPDAMLGVAEDDTVSEHFYSLGFGGTATLGFENGISSGVVVVEATNLGYPTEHLKVEVSTNGTTFVDAGTISQDGEVSVPRGIGCVKWVRVTDASNPADFVDGSADGYDVDGIEAQGVVCYTDKKMTGGGSVWKSDGTRVTHGMQLNCDASKSTLEVNWGKGNKFHLENMTAALCTDNPNVESGMPISSFDTFWGMGEGRLNGVTGYKAEWTFVDAGEPGTKDTARITIYDPSNAVVFIVDSMLKNGNQQAH